MGEHVVSLSGVNKSFTTGFFMKKVRALRDVNLTIEKGEIFGYLGPNGSGKTTTLKLMMGIIHPDSGAIEVMSRSPQNIAVKKNIGFLPESPYFYEHLTAREFLSFYANLFDLPSGLRRERIAKLLSLVGLTDKSDEHLRRYSRGMLQRIGIAQALINDPSLIVLDEPMGGLDPIGRAEVKEIIMRLKREGKTIVFSSHILPDVEVMADRVGIIVKGQIRDVGSLDELIKKRVHSIEITAHRPKPKLAESLHGKARVKRETGDDIVFEVSSPHALNAAIDIIRKSETDIVSIEPLRMTLEELFLSELKKGEKS